MRIPVIAAYCFDLIGEQDLRRFEVIFQMRVAQLLRLRLVDRFGFRFHCFKQCLNPLLLRLYMRTKIPMAVAMAFMKILGCAS